MNELNFLTIQVFSLNIAVFHTFIKYYRQVGRLTTLILIVDIQYQQRNEVD